MGKHSITIGSITNSAFVIGGGQLTVTDADGNTVTVSADDEEDD